MLRRALQAAGLPVKLDSSLLKGLNLAPGKLAPGKGPDASAFFDFAYLGKTYDNVADKALPRRGLDTAVKLDPGLLKELNLAPGKLAPGKGPDASAFFDFAYLGKTYDQVGQVGKVGAGKRGLATSLPLKNEVLKGVNLAPGKLAPGKGPDASAFFDFAYLGKTYDKVEQVGQVGKVGAGKVVP